MLADQQWGVCFIVSDISSQKSGSPPHMKAKGYHKTTSPEKMPVYTTGIEMTRGDRATENPNAREYLTGGNGVADETGVKNLVLRFIKMIKA